MLSIFSIGNHFLLPDLDNIKFSIMFYGAITIVLCINYLGES